MGKTNHKSQSVRAGAGLAQGVSPIPSRLRILTVTVPGKSLSEQLWSVRHWKGWDIATASKKLGVPRMVIYRMEFEGEMPSPRILKKIQDGYGITIGIFGDANSTTKLPNIKY